MPPNYRKHWRSLNEARTILANLKQQLIAQNETTVLFAQERGDGLSALLDNLEQTVFGEAAYPSIESKAAHLLYFVVKKQTAINAVAHFYL